MDGISNHGNCHDIGASEVCWRWFEFPILQKKPVVECLLLHSSDQQMIVLNPYDAQIAFEKRRSIELTACFKMNEDPLAKDSLYYYFLQHYTWRNNNKKRRRWVRQSDAIQEVIDWVYGVHPSQSELFYLKSLLQHKATNFGNLIIINSVFENFKQAC